MTKTSAKIKIAGSWTGVLEVDIDTWTLPMLRSEIARRSNSTPEAIKLISAGRVLKDGIGDETLSSLGLKENSKILSTRISEGSGKDLATAEERNARLARIKSATDALAKRHSCGKLTDDDFDIEVADQEGRVIQIPEVDRKALMMCLMLHTFGRRLMRNGKYEEALEVLITADESSSLCNKATTEMVDNISILQIDIVWCYFKLRDIKWLSMAGERLERAWQGLAKSHGENIERFRHLQSASSIDVPLYLKLDLLRGVIEFHTGRFESAKEHLTAAQLKFSKLDVSDESLSLLVSLGYGTSEAKRALRMHNQNEAAAVSFLIEENEKKLAKDEDDRQRSAELREQRRYGKTESGAGVDLKKLGDLESVGYDRSTAAEALRRRDNDFDMAIEDLTDVNSNLDIQESVESRKRTRHPARLIGEDRAAAEMAAGTAADTAVETAAGGTSSNEAVAMEMEGSSSGEKRDEDMEGEITLELANHDPLSDYDIDMADASGALQQYISLVDAALSLPK